MTAVADLAWLRAADLMDGTGRRTYATPGELARVLDAKTIQTPALDLIDAELVDIANGDCDRLMVALGPQEGKSQRISRRFPLWMLTQNPDLRIAIVSYAHNVARRWGRAIRDDIRDHPELGLTVDPTSSAQHEWNLLGHDGSVYCVGITGSLTSRPVDLLIIDDPYKDAGQADSEAWNETVQEFWTEVAVPRLAGAPVVIIQTRWRENDLSGWLQSGDNGDAWRVINIPAEADHDPAKGQTDPLGREPGEYLQSARGRTRDDWEQKKREVGSRSWNALYQGRPSPAAGDILQRGWWQHYTNPMWVRRPDGSYWAPVADGGARMIQSWDLAFKATSSSDWVVGQVWMSDGVQAWLLDQVRGRFSFVETMREMVRLSAKWPQAVLKLVEDKANGPAVMSALNRRLPGLVPEEPHGSKESRAQAIAPFLEAGNVLVPSPDLCPWVGDLIEEAAAFPNGAHDDQTDAMSQALNRLLLTPILTAPNRLVTMRDLDAEIADYSISAW